MLKTIKTTRYMRLDELIKYCVENDIEDEKFKIGGSKNKIVPKGLGFGVEKNLDYKEFSVSRSGIFTVTGDVNKSDLFPVEVEEKITKETVFDLLIALYKDADVEGGHDMLTHYDKSVKRILDRATNKRCPVKEIHALINGKLELIWERE